MRPYLGLFGTLLLAAACAGTARARDNWPRVVHSRDGTPISYEVQGIGEPDLVFVHGWSCDSRYWREQVPHFSRHHRVIVLDLAGHGHSGFQRRKYDMASFGEDVQAVMEAAGSRRAVLIGHSMGGSVIAEAARLLPGKVVGLIGVDTLENVEYPLTSEAAENMIAPLREDFSAGVRKFVQSMLRPSTDPELAEWIAADMASASPRVALSAMKEMLVQYVTGAAAKVFEAVRLPVVVVNGDLWPIDYEANRRHMLSFDAIVLKNSDHFLMLDRPEEFNRALEAAIGMVTGKGRKEPSGWKPLLRAGGTAAKE